MELVRKYLTADEIGTPAIRWNSDCDCVQQSPDGGETWVDVPSADPRSAPGYAMPPASSDDPRCDGAERMIAALKRLIDIVVSSAGSVAAVSAVLGYLADFIFGIGTLVALILEAVTGMLAIGQEVLDLAFTTDVYDQIKCYAYGRLEIDGHFDDAGWAGFQDDVLGAFGGTVNIAMGLIFQLEGINGFNNAASVGTETGDCAACACTYPILVTDANVSGYATYAAFGQAVATLTPPAEWVNNGVWYGFGNGQIWSEIKVTDLPFNAITGYVGEIISADIINDDSALETGGALLVTLFNASDVQLQQSIFFMSTSQTWQAASDTVSWTGIVSTDYLVITTGHTSDHGHAITSGTIGGRNFVLSVNC